MKLSGTDLCLHIETDTISPTKFVRDLGVVLDNELSMTTHANKISGICFYRLWRVKNIRRIIGPEITARLLSAYIISGIDYFNSTLAGLHKFTTALLQRVQNSAAGLVKRSGTRVPGPLVHISSALRDLHWLPANFRIIIKLCLMMHTAHNHRCPVYIIKLVTSTASISSRSRLCLSIINRYEVPKTRRNLGESTFSVASPTAWNNLSEEIFDIREIYTFKSKLKTLLPTFINSVIRISSQWWRHVLHCLWL